MRKVLLGILVGLAFAAPHSADEWVVEAHYHRSAPRCSARRVISSTSSSIASATCCASTRPTRASPALEAEGLVVTIDSAATARLQAANARVAAFRERLAHEGKSAVINGIGYASIPGYECFRTVEDTYQTMDDLVTAHPDIAVVDDIGPTWKKTQDSTQGYEMRAMHITNFATLASDPDRPKLAVFFSIHAREYTPAEIGTRFAEWLVNNYGTDPEATWLVDHNDFHLILLANPDARKEAEQQIYQRKNLDDTYGSIGLCGDDEFSQFGIDLNRNFPFHWNITLGQGSDDDTCSQTYHGPYLDRQQSPAAYPGRSRARNGQSLRLCRRHLRRRRQLQRWPLRRPPHRLDGSHRLQRHGRLRRRRRRARRHERRLSSTCTATRRWCSGRGATRRPTRRTSPS